VDDLNRVLGTDNLCKAVELAHRGLEAISHIYRFPINYIPTDNGYSHFYRRSPLGLNCHCLGQRNCDHHDQDEREVKESFHNGSPFLDKINMFHDFNLAQI